MRVPLILLLLCLACAGASYAVAGPDLTSPLVVSLIAAFAALLLTVMAVLGRDPASGPQVVIDGSNVMHWNGEVPRLDPLREVIASLQQNGYQPGVIFDANAGYKLTDRYLDDRHFAKLLNLPGDRVLVVGKGEPADPTILAAARELGAKVVTNDRFRDWTGDFPEVATPGHLVRGGYRSGKLWLDAGALAKAG